MNAQELKRTRCDYLEPMPVPITADYRKICFCGDDVFYFLEKCRKLLVNSNVHVQKNKLYKMIDIIRCAIMSTNAFQENPSSVTFEDMEYHTIKIRKFKKKNPDFIVNVCQRYYNQGTQENWGMHSKCANKNKNKNKGKTRSKQRNHRNTVNVLQGKNWLNNSMFERPSNEVVVDDSKDNVAYDIQSGLDDFLEQKDKSEFLGPGESGKQTDKNKCLAEELNVKQLSGLLSDIMSAMCNSADQSRPPDLEEKSTIKEIPKNTTTSTVGNVGNVDVDNTNTSTNTTTTKASTNTTAKTNDDATVNTPTIPTQCPQTDEKKEADDTH